jgi:hypothetical protein
MPSFDVGVRDFVQIQPIGNEEWVLVSDANGWRLCVAGMNHILGGVSLQQSVDMFCYFGNL